MTKTPAECEAYWTMTAAALRDTVAADAEWTPKMLRLIISRCVRFALENERHLFAAAGDTNEIALEKAQEYAGRTLAYHLRQMEVNGGK